MEVVEGHGRQKVEEYLDKLLQPEKVKGVAMEVLLRRGLRVLLYRGWTNMVKSTRGLVICSYSSYSWLPLLGEAADV